MTTKEFVKESDNDLRRLLEFEYKWAQGIEEQVLFSNNEFRLLQQLEFKIKKRKTFHLQQLLSSSDSVTQLQKEGRKYSNDHY
jgi:hypothetical protein